MTTSGVNTDRTQPAGDTDAAAASALPEDIQRIVDTFPPLPPALRDEIEVLLGRSVARAAADGSVDAA